MRIELQESTIINATTGEKICDISELSDYGQAMYIIELLMKDRQKAEEDYLEILEEKRKDITKTIERLDYKISLYNEIYVGKRKDFMEDI